MAKLTSKAPQAPRVQPLHVRAAGKLVPSQLLTSMIIKNGKAQHAHTKIAKTIALLNLSSRKDTTKTHMLIRNALDACRPLFKLRKTRVGPSKYTIPAILGYNQSLKKAAKWLAASCVSSKKKGSLKTVPFHVLLAKHLTLAAAYKGPAVALKINLHKTAEKNRAFAHHKWW